MRIERKRNYNPMNEPIDSYLAKMDTHAKHHDDAPPMVMTLAKAQALIAAHEGGIGMSDDLLGKARGVVWDLTASDEEKEAYEEMIREEFEAEERRQEDNKRQWDEYFEEEYRAGRM